MKIHKYQVVICYSDDELRFMYENGQGHLTLFCIVFVWLRGRPSTVRSPIPSMYQNRLGPSGGIYYPNFVPCFVYHQLNSCELPSLYSSYYKKVFPKWMNCGIFRQSWSLFGQYLQAQHLCSAFKQSSQMWDFCGNSAISAHIIREESPQWGVCSMQHITQPCQDYTANIYKQPYQ